MTRTLLLATALALLTSPAPFAFAQTEPVSLTVPQARSAAVQAMVTGDLETADRLSRGLIAVQPEDPSVWALDARVADALKSDPRALSSAGRAFRLATDRPLRFRAADLAARAAFRSGRYTLAQYWLRRATDLAPSDEIRARVIEDYRLVRRVNPLRFALDLSVTPSSNVNGGASTDSFEVSGLDAVYGTLSAEAQALSGWEMRGRLSGSWRLSESSEQQTRLTFGTTLRRVALSDSAKDDAPDAENSDFALTVIDTGLSHKRALPGGRAVLDTGLSLGRAWYGGSHDYDFARGTLGVTARVDPRWTLFGLVNRELRHGAEDAAPTDTFDRLRLGAVMARENGDRVTLALNFSASDRDDDRNDGRGMGVDLRYALGAPVAGVSLAAGLSLSRETYDDYSVPVFLVGSCGAIICLEDVPGGREDNSVALSLEMQFERVGYAGFVPVVTLEGRRSDSNVSRFDTESLGLQIGLRSAF
ncbi:hypothetical protein [Litorisediminicola beolgyonensis]|uniref:DUF560 domain-containing protein n=1 Tax=Litorisediminicola beolgyonensis TaxID=1173614 RepID=A0ABW3ZMS1_9RHOB